MQLTDQRDIKAAPGVVWDALLDADVLKACVPGCETMTGSATTGFEAAVVQKVGPVKARFTGLVAISDVVAGQSCTISGEGKGGPAGYARGGAKVSLQAIPGGTRLFYDVQANVGGKLAQLGSRIIDGFAKKMADQFFERFQQTVEAAGAAGPDERPVPEMAAAGAEAGADGGAEAAGKGWLKRMFG